MWFPIIEKMNKAKLGNIEETVIKNKVVSKMKNFRAFSSKDNYVIQKYYQDADCWYELDTMKLLKDNPVWGFSKKINIDRNYSAVWVSDNNRSSNIKLEGMELKNRGTSFVYDDNLRQALAPLITKVYCPESDQTINLSRENLVRFCLFLREPEIQELQRIKEENKKAIEKAIAKKMEMNKQIIKNKHKIATNYIAEQIIEDTKNNPDTMPLELKKDYDNYIKVLETIRLGKQ